MNIILNEIKKIFTIKKLIILGLITFVIYNMFISFYVTYFPNGRPSLDHYNISKEMIAKYGNELDENEFEDFKKSYDEKIEQADDIVINNKNAQALGWKSYEDIDIKKSMEVEREIFNTNEDLFYDIQTRESIISNYEDKNNAKFHNFNTKQLGRFQEIIDKEYNFSILDGFTVFQNYNDFMGLSGFLICICVMFISSNIFLDDNKNKTNYLQYSSKIGRKLFKKKIIAGIISTVTLTTLYLATLLWRYFFTTIDTTMFFNCTVNSFLNGLYWHNLTYLQYIILIVILIYILAIATSLISMYISSKVSSYIGLIGFQVPIMIACYHIIPNFLLRDVGSIYYSKLLLPIVYILIFIIPIILIVLRYRNEKRKDIIS
ncbi:ABC transporter permease subunit [Clostridium tarantellae]|uniref:Uncharacterized protein n=1 Tax=Clostridium tarantellae TaxID=39493 RepID=A0A6I1MMC7_9CLOT|nr:ABC transporter permease subunit [Clostridium tarantellae]MPQ43913.1 hypothetical protein [Clostridium tarantellae]